MKFIFRKSDGKVLGAQALGEDGPAVDKRISALAVAIQMGATIYDLEESELCYAPQFGSAKDPVNFAGMIAANVLRGDMPVSHWDSLDGAFILDVRQPVELVVESVPGAVNIPLHELRVRLDERHRSRQQGLRQVMFSTPDGLVPIDALGRIDRKRGLAEITRKNRQRMVSVGANLSSGTLVEKVDAIQERVPLRRRPGE